MLAVSDDGGAAIAVEGLGYGADIAVVLLGPVADGGVARPSRRIKLQGVPAALGIAADGSFGVVLVRSRQEVLRIDLTSHPALSALGQRAQPCLDPTHLAVGRSTVLVACRTGEAILLDAAGLTKLVALPLGGPPVDMVLAPDREQAIVTLGDPVFGAVVIHLERRVATPVARGEPIEAVRYSPNGRVATAFSPQRGRVLVLR
jgi:hypothetical protein